MYLGNAFPPLVAQLDERLWFDVIEVAEGRATAPEALAAFLEYAAKVLPSDPKSDPSEIPSAARNAFMKGE